MTHPLFLHNILLLLLHIILLNKVLLTQPEVQIQTSTLTRQPTLPTLSVQTVYKLVQLLTLFIPMQYKIP